VVPFIKAETYPEFKPPRWINASCDEFKVCSGRWFHAIEEVVFGAMGALNHVGNNWFIKHVPVDKRAQRILELRLFGDLFIGSDFTSFEASFTPEVMMACECQLYSYMLQNFPMAAKYINEVLTGIRYGHSSVGVGFSRPGGRMSGDPCTSLGNGFTNLMLWLFWSKECAIPICGYVEGDDGLFAVKSTQYDRAVNPTEFFMKLGFDVKASLFSEPGEASFCGILCSPDGQLMRDLHKVVTNSAWSWTNPNAGLSKSKKLLRAKALSLAIELPNCPIERALADYLLRITSGVQAQFSDRYHVEWLFGAPALSLTQGALAMLAETKVAQLAEQVTTQDTRVMFEKKFGVTVCDQLVIEQEVRSGNLKVLELCSATFVKDGHIKFCTDQATARWEFVQYK